MATRIIVCALVHVWCEFSFSTHWRSTRISNSPEPCRTIFIMPATKFTFPDPYEYQHGFQQYKE